SLHIPLTIYHHPFILSLRRTPISTLFPYTTLFRSLGSDDKTLGLIQGPFFDQKAKDNMQLMQMLFLVAALQLFLVTVVNIVSVRSEEHTSELQSRENLVCRLLLEKIKSSRTVVRRS